MREMGAGGAGWAYLFIFDLALLQIYCTKNFLTKKEFELMPMEYFRPLESDMANLYFYLKKHFLGCLSTRRPSVCVPC